MSRATATASRGAQAERVAAGRDERWREAERVRAATAAVVAEHVAPQAAALDRDGGFPDAQLRALANAGLGGLLVPVEHGGAGASKLAYAMAVEEIAAACGATSLVYMTQMHCAHPLLVAGSPAQRAALLPPLCRSERWGALAVTEPGAGSDTALIATMAVRDGEHYVVDGAKTFITSGDRSHVTILFAVTGPGAGRHGVSAFALEGRPAGMSTGRVFGKLGMHGSSTAELFFDDCRIPAAWRLGEEGAGYPLLLSAVGTSRLSAAAQGVGLGAGALAAARAWATARGLLDRHRREHQHVQAAFARLWTKLRAARTLLHDTALRADLAAPGEDLSAAVAAAKAFCTDTGMRVASTAMELMGADGDDPALHVERYVRDAKVTQIYDGANEIQLGIVARATAPLTPIDAAQVP